MKTNEIKRFLLLGGTGSGKSTFINYVTNYLEGEKSFNKVVNDTSKFKMAIPCKNWNENIVERFKKHSNEKNIEDSTVSQTSECYEYLFEKQNISFIDTPGINDTNGCNNDIMNLKKIVDSVAKESNLNGIILLINGTMVRLDTSTVNFISILKSFLPKQMIENVIVILTNCEEESCNFELKCLKDIFANGKKYTMQNKLFRWDKKTKFEKDSKLYKTNEISWNESIKTLGSLISELKKMPSLSTKQFKINEETADKLSKQILEHIDYLTDLVE